MSNYSDSIFVPESTNNSWAHLYGYIPDGSRVLDIGCSSGNFGQVLMQKKGCQVVGLDLDEADVKLAKTKLTDARVFNIETDDISKLGTFDVVVMADVIEHLADPVASLKRVKQLLAKDGRLVFSIPNMAHISIRLMLLEGFFEYTDKWLLDRTHFHYYDEVEVKHVLNEASFSIEEMYPTTVAYPKAVLTKRLNKVGLNPNDSFFKQMTATKADVFEFVGLAKPTSKKMPVKRTLTYQFPPDELSQEILARDQTIQELQDQTNALNTEVAAAKQELENVIHSRSWKATKPLRKVAQTSRKLRKK